MRSAKRKCRNGVYTVEIKMLFPSTTKCRVTNNLVLGIDEYLKGEARNEDIEFIEFKKFFQRIHKETGCLYKSWLAKMEEQKEIKEITSIHKRSPFHSR